MTLNDMMWCSHAATDAWYDIVTYGDIGDMNKPWFHGLSVGAAMLPWMHGAVMLPQIYA